MEKKKLKQLTPFLFNDGLPIFLIQMFSYSSLIFIPTDILVYSMVGNQQAKHFTSHPLGIFYLE